MCYFPLLRERQLYSIFYERARFGDVAKANGGNNDTGACYAARPDPMGTPVVPQILWKAHIGQVVGVME
jgi:hypothetical protein